MKEEEYKEAMKDSMEGTKLFNTMLKSMAQGKDVYGLDKFLVESQIILKDSPIILMAVLDYYKKIKEGKVNINLTSNYQKEEGN